MVLVFRDVTGRRESEAQLQRLNHDLRRTNQDLQQFSYAASHDLKEPLRTVSNYLQLIRSRYSGKVLDEEAGNSSMLPSRALSECMRWWKRCWNIRARRGGRFHAGTGAGGQSGPRRNHQSAKFHLGNQRRMSLIGRSPVVTANPLHLTQVFENLIGNALKYRSEATSAYIDHRRRGSARLGFSVEDNGIGIPAEYQAQIFGIFKRLHGDEYPGTGIGLATCKKIVDRHGGTIWVEVGAWQGLAVLVYASQAAGESPT